MPVHDGEAYLPQAIDSILTQTLPDFELIVVDDGSQDGTRTVLEEVSDSRLVVYRNPRRQGLVSSLNRALVEARGVFIARMDADDISLPTRFERQVHLLQRVPHLQVVGSQIEIIDEAERKIGTWHFPLSPGSIRWRMLFASSLAHPSVMARASFFDEVGRYSASGTEDYELWLRNIETVHFANLGSVLLRYRRHSRSVSSGEPASYSNAAERAGLDAISRLVDYSVDVETLRALWVPEEIGDDEPAGKALKLLRDIYAWFATLADVTSLEREYARRHAAATAARILKALSRTDKIAAFDGYTSLSWLGRIYLLQSKNRRPDLLDLVADVYVPR